MAETKKKWIQDAVPESHRGAFTDKAKRAHESIAAHAKKVRAKGSRASTKTKLQAALAQRFQRGI